MAGFHRNSVMQNSRELTAVKNRLRQRCKENEDKGNVNMKVSLDEIKVLLDSIPEE